MARAIALDFAEPNGKSPGLNVPAFSSTPDFTRSAVDHSPSKTASCFRLSLSKELTTSANCRAKDRWFREKSRTSDWLTSATARNPSPLDFKDPTLPVEGLFDQFAADGLDLG
jgi:hypothetical protein